MSIKPIIRPYRDSDKDRLISILRSNTPKYFASEEEVHLSSFLENELQMYFVIEVQLQIVGSGGINFDKNNILAVLSWDLIHPDFQNKSLGTLLVNYRLQLLKTHNTIERISVRTSQHVYKFYEKQGFVLQSIENDYWAIGFDLYEMSMSRAK
ncbi:MAG TPA: GNAT family N-acetyltransferase [Cytophagaceae bacterium]